MSKKKKYLLKRAEKEIREHVIGGAHKAALGATRMSELVVGVETHQAAVCRCYA